MVSRVFVSRHELLTFYHYWISAAFALVINVIIAPFNSCQFTIFNNTFSKWVSDCQARDNSERVLTTKTFKWDGSCQHSLHHAHGKPTANSHLGNTCSLSPPCSFQCNEPSFFLLSLGLRSHLLSFTQSIIEVFLTCFAGYILARHGVLDKKTQKVRSLSFSLLTSKHIFSKWTG